MRISVASKADIPHSGVSVSYQQLRCTVHPDHRALGFYQGCGSMYKRFCV